MQAPTLCPHVPFCLPSKHAPCSDQSAAAVQHARVEQQHWQRAIAASPAACWLLSEQG